MGQPVDVSLVLVNWNTRAMLEDCLETVFRLTRGVSFEVLVVDNASTDGSAQAVRRRFPLARLIENRANLGFARGCNQGIAASRGRYVLLLNTDTLLLNDAVSESAAFADRHPETAVVGCRVRNPDLSIQDTTFMFPSLLNLLLEVAWLARLLPRSRFFGRSRMSWWDRREARRVDVVTGCFLLVRRECFDLLGPLDESFFMYGEETDFCYRVRRAGWRVTYVPAGEIVHFGGGSSRRAAPQMTLQLRASILLFFRKHFGRARYLAACALTGAFFLVRVPYWLLSALASGSSARLQTGRLYALGFRRALGGWKALEARPGLME